MLKDRTMTRRNKAVLIGAGGLLLLVAIGALVLTSSRSQADAVPPGSRPRAVEVGTVGRATLSRSVSAVGTVVPLSDVTVSSETSGRILKVLVKVGDTVRGGQPLLLVDAELREAAVEQASAQARAAEAQAEKARRDLERSETLFASGDIADVELEVYRLALRSAEAARAAAAAGLVQARRALRDTRIAAPGNGLVASRKVEAGEMLAPGMEVANIIDISSVKIKLSVPEEEVVQLSAGQEVTVTVDALPGLRLPGTIYTVGAKSESPSGHTYPVEVIVKNDQQASLRAGMFARVEIRTGVAEDALVIPKEALIGEGARASVYVVEDGVAWLREVKLGLQGQDSLQVLAGLEQGDRIVTFGQKVLRDGSAVRYK